MNQMNPSQLQRPQQKIGVRDTVAVKCDKCSNATFINALFMRKVSALMTGTGKASYVPIEQAITCTKCGHCNDEFIPDELKETSIIIK